MTEPMTDDQSRRRDTAGRCHATTDAATDRATTDAPWRDAVAAPSADRVRRPHRGDDARGEARPARTACWVGASDDGGDVAPHQHEMTGDVDLDALLPPTASASSRGPFGTAPVDAAVGAQSRSPGRSSASSAASRFGIPALVHEECLAGFAAWRRDRLPGAAVVGRRRSTPTSSSGWRARIGDDLRSVGVHQGLAPGARRRARRPVGPRRGDASARTRTSSARSAPPTCADSSPPASSRRSSTSSGTRPRGPAATSRPSRSGARELADVLLPPFEMAVREGGARSVMNAYTDLDGVPVGRRPRAAHRPPARDVGLRRHRRRRLLRRRVPADSCTASPATCGEAAAAALEAGIDVELPTVRGVRRAAVRRAVASARVDEAVVDRALLRVLARRPSSACSTPTGPRPPACACDRAAEACAHRPRLRREPGARRAASPRRRSCCCRNDGTLPARRPGAHRRDRPERRRPATPCSAATRSRRTSCVHHPERRDGHRASRRSLEALRAEFPDGRDPFARGHRASTAARPTGIADAVGARGIRRRRRSLALGDRAGLFGRGTSGEGCDVGVARAARARSGSSSTPCSRRARRPCSCCSPAGRTRSDAPRRSRPAIVAGVLPGRGGRPRRSRACSAAASTRAAGCP